MFRSSSEAPFHTENFALALSLHCAGIPAPEDKIKGKTAKLPLIHIYDEQNLKALGYSGLTIENAARLAFEEGKHGQIAYAFQRLPILSDLLSVFDRERALPVSRDTIVPRFMELVGKAPRLGVQEAAVCATVIALAMRKLVSFGEYPDLSSAAFVDQVGWLDKSTLTIAEEIQRILKNDSARTVGNNVSRLFATIIRARNLLGDLWKTQEPLIRVHKPGKPVRIPHAAGGYSMRMPGFVLCPLNASVQDKRELGLI